MSRAHFTRGDRVTFGASNTVWRVISVSTGPGGHQKATVRSTVVGSSAWRYDRKMTDALPAAKP